MAIGATEVGAIKASLSLDVSKFQSGMDRAKRDLTQVDNAATKTTRSFDGLASAMVALGAGASLTGLIRTIGALVDDSNKLTMSLQGLSEVAKALGINVKEATGLAEELAAKGFLSIAEASTAVKTALSTGLNLEDTRKLILATADAAAYNREAHLSWGEAIVQVTRGIKSGNSELTDAAGITTNLSVMYDRYAISIGTTAAALTEAQKIQAAYNGIMEESALFTGNADTALDGFAGTQADFTNTVATARAEIGEAFLPIVQELIETVTPLIKSFADWSTENKDLVVGVTSGTAAFLGLTTVLGGLVTVMAAVRVAAIALGVSLGPIGWTITAISVAAGAFTAYKTSATEAADAQRELNDLMIKTPLSRNASDVKDLQSKMESLNGVLDERNKFMREYEQRMKDAEQGRGSIENTHAIFELADAIKAADKELGKMGLTAEEAEERIAQLNAEIDKSVPALLELNRAERTEISTKVAKLNTIKDLRSRYDELTKSQSLSTAQTTELKSVVEKLSKEYPQLNKYIDDKNRIQSDGIGILDDAIGAEERYYGRKADLLKADLLQMKQNAAAEKAIIDARVASLDEFAKKAQDAPANLSPATRMSARTSATLADQEAERARASSDAYALAIAEIDAAIAGTDIKSGNGGGETDGDADTKTGTTIKQTAEQLAQGAYQSALQQLEVRRLLGKLTEEDEEKRLAELADKYKRYDDIWIDAESRRQRVADQLAADRETLASKSAQKRFDHSAEWIEQETRNMTLAGESDEAVAQMRIEAWARVRSRYEKDTEYYKRADTELYQLRLSLMREAEDVAADAQKQAKESADSAIKAIDKQKRAELDAIDERRKAIREFYEEQADLIDDGERMRERSDLLSEISKYSGATSEQGRRHLAELQERLRKMDLDDQREALNDERDEKLAALDEQQSDIESWYSDMKTLLEDYNGDFITIYQQTENERFNAFTTTNAEILAELERFKSEYESIMSGVSTGSSTSTVAQMAANAAAWKTADSAGRQRLANENQTLGSSIGASYDTGSGKWYGADGLSLFHTGRDGFSGQTFSAGNRLLPDEIAAILRKDESVFTPGQLSSLIDGVRGRGGSGGNTYIDKQVMVEVNDATFEDEIDTRALGRTAVDMAADLRRSGLQGTEGGS